MISGNGSYWGIEAWAISSESTCICESFLKDIKYRVDWTSCIFSTFFQNGAVKGEDKVVKIVLALKWLARQCNLTCNTSSS